MFSLSRIYSGFVMPNFFACFRIASSMLISTYLKEASRIVSFAVFALSRLLILIFEDWAVILIHPSPPSLVDAYKKPSAVDIGR
ncbi:hypothetical protein FKM82_025865 [Ascaphus truei]